MTMTDPAHPGGAWRPVRLFRPVDGASLAAFRILFGLVLAAGVLRFTLSGWVHELFVRPDFFFKYAGFEWVVVPPPAVLYTLFGALVVLALCVALGLFYRVSVVLFGLGFAYVQLMDQANYLNHYYLVVLLFGLMAFLPLHATWSLDARRRPALARTHLPAWMLWLLRFQVGVVYVYAAVAKLGTDWLLHAQPLQIWTSARTDLPLIGPWLAEPWAPYLMAWGGFLYDAAIVPLLLWRRTRALAYAAVLVFHGLTHVFFDIGMFPFIMVAATTVFFAPDWPRRLLRRAAPPAPAPVLPSRPLRRAGAAVITVYCAFQALFPARHFLYPGDVLWNELGMRYAWKVMVREKQGSITYRVRSVETGREWLVNPANHLQLRQLSEMSGQPDQILQLAHYIRDDFRRQGRGEVEVRVDAWVSLNGRRPQRMIDPDADLTRLPAGSTDWILPGPTTAPIARVADRSR